MIASMPITPIDTHDLHIHGNALASLKLHPAPHSLRKNRCLIAIRAHEGLKIEVKSAENG